jgi:hypothetical protein
MSLLGFADAVYLMATLNGGEKHVSLMRGSIAMPLVYTLANLVFEKAFSYKQVVSISLFTVMSGILSFTAF